MMQFSARQPAEENKMQFSARQLAEENKMQFFAKTTGSGTFLLSKLQCGGGPQSFMASGRPVKIPTSAEM